MFRRSHCVPAHYICKMTTIFKICQIPLPPRDCIDRQIPHSRDILSRQIPPHCPSSPCWYTVISTRVEIGKTRNCVELWRHMWIWRHYRADCCENNQLIVISDCATIGLIWIFLISFANLRNSLQIPSGNLQCSHRLLQYSNAKNFILNFPNFLF
jgi:hypothetical protein